MRIPDRFPGPLPAPTGGDTDPLRFFRLPGSPRLRGADTAGSPAVPAGNARRALKQRGTLGRTRPPSRPGSPPPHDGKRQNVFCIRDRLSLYLSPSFLSTDRATKSVSVFEKASAADPFSARRETMHTADVVLSFPGRFQLAKSRFLRYNRDIIE